MKTILLFYKHLFTIILLFLCSMDIKAQDTLFYSAGQNPLDIGSHARFYKDAKDTFKLVQIMALSDASFQKSETEIMNFGNTAESIWVKLYIKNKSDEPLFLSFDNYQLQYIDLVVFDEKGLKQQQTSGTTAPLKNRYFQRGNSILEVGQKPSVIYINVKTNTGFCFPVTISNAVALVNVNHKYDVLKGLGTGILLAMALYNLFIFFSLKDRLYLYYCIYVFVSIWTTAHINGIWFFLRTDYAIFNDFVGIQLLILVALLFTVRFLNLDQNMPRTYTAIKIFSVLIALIIPIECFDIQPLANHIMEALTPIAGISMLLVGVLSYLQGNKSAKYYVLAWIFFLIGGMTTSLCYDGVLPYNNFTSNALLLGACVENILLGFALANRINIYREESALAQALAFQRLTENEMLIKEQNKNLEEKVNVRTMELESSLDVLKKTQNQLIQSEKLASLGELTAGISHEIQNPLNFVSNFSDLSIDLTEELKAEIGNSPLTPEGGIMLKDKAYIDEILADLSSNQVKINHHSNRASNIVKGMLDHSRVSNGTKELTDINKMADEYLRLSFHGLRAKNKDFNADFKMDFEENLPKISVISQDIGRVMLNLFSNAFHAVNKRNVSEVQNLTDVKIYQPTVSISTQSTISPLGIKEIIITVIDNGTGMPEEVKTKIFQPFFTTKPTGDGTGLGLSLSYDIVTKGHDGTLEVESTEGIGTIFIIKLPY